MPIPHRLPLLVAFALATFGLDAPAQAATAAENGAARIESLRAQRDWLGALALIERNRTGRPDDPALYRLQVLTLRDLGSSERAWTLYRARPELFSADEASRLEAARLARLIVWSGLYAETTETRDQEMQLAQKALDRRLAERPSLQRQNDLRTRFDEIVLLNLLERHAEAVERYRALQAQGVEVPPYAMARAAESLLAERHPEEAAQSFEQVVRAMPDNFDAKLLLAYAYSESERFDAAYAQLERLKTEEPTWLRAPGARQGHANYRHYQADGNLAMMHLYGQDSAGAQQRLEALAAIGPDNAGLQADLGEVYQQRGWSERALERFQVANTLEPENVDARIGRVGALLSLGRIDLARPLHDRLLAGHPRDVQVRQMDRTWNSQLGWQWQVNLSRGRSDDGDRNVSPLGSRDGEYRFAIQSPLLDDRWRLTTQAHDAWAEYQGDRVRDRRVGVGVSYAFDRLRAEAGVDRANDGWAGDDLGHYVNAGWRFDDRWNAYAGWYRNSPNASLQARRAGIAADELTLGVDWTPSDYARVDANVQQLRYEDGNRREGLSVSAQQRLVTTPHLLLDGVLGVHTSRGSHDDVPYFNPRRDASLRLGARLDHITWRRYTRHFRQRATVSIGPYWQEGFGSAWVPELRYEHEWRFGTGRLLQYGVTWSRPVYDGVREERLGFDLGFRWGE